MGRPNPTQRGGLKPARFAFFFFRLKWFIYKQMLKKKVYYAPHTVAYRLVSILFFNTMLLYFLYVCALLLCP